MRFGILGTASIARRAIIPAVANTEHEVVAIASRDAGRAKAVSDTFDIPNSYGDYGAMLSNSDVDAVYVALPNSMHEEWTIRAAEHGRHVLCEKPLATDASAARRMRDRCAAAGVTLMEAFMYRYHPRTERAAAIANEELGDVRTMTATFQSPRSGTIISLDPELGGGSLLHNGCYPVDAARAFLGDPRRVYGTMTDTRGVGVDTQFTGVLEYDDGVTASVTSGYDTGRSIARYRFEATDGWCDVRSAFVPGAEAETSLRYAVGDRQVSETFPPADQYRLEIEHFADCVRTGKPPRTGGDEGVKNMVVIEALRESAERGTPISLEP